MIGSGPGGYVASIKAAQLGMKVRVDSMIICCICCGSILSLVQIFFSFFLGMVMYDNNMIMSLKQKERKFEPRIKLNHNIYMLNKV